MSSMDKSDIIETLEFIDNKIGNTINEKSKDVKVEIILVGGSAISIGYNSPRYTFDIDCLPVTPDELNSQLEKLGFDILTQTFLLLPDEFRDRLKEINGFKYINVYTISAMDLILSKLARGSSKDVDDCRWLIGNKYVELEKLLKEYDEWKLYYPFNENTLQTTFDLVIEGF